MTTHLIPTIEAFAAYVEREYGPGAQLHPANRRTACSRRPDRSTMSITEDAARATCKVCARRGAEGTAPWMERDR